MNAPVIIEKSIWTILSLRDALLAGDIGITLLSVWKESVGHWTRECLGRAWDPRKENF